MGGLEMKQPKLESVNTTLLILHSYIVLVTESPYYQACASILGAGLFPYVQCEMDIYVHHL